MQTHVAYQIKGNEAYNNMLANILPLHTPWVGSKCQNNVFLKVVMLHTKLTGMKHRTQCKQIICPFTHPRPWMRSKQETFFLKVVMLHTKLKGKKCRTLCK